MTESNPMPITREIYDAFQRVEFDRWDAGERRSRTGFITFVLHWKHTKDFGGLAPTGREGTSVETMILTIEAGKVGRIDIADNTLDLAIYEWERGWPVPHNVRPEPPLEGLDRRVA